MYIPTIVRSPVISPRLQFRDYFDATLSASETMDAIDSLARSGTARMGREPRRANYVRAVDVVASMDGMGAVARCLCGGIHGTTSRAWQLLHPANLGAADIASAVSRSVARNYFPPAQYMRLGCIDCPEQRN